MTETNSTPVFSLLAYFPFGFVVSLFQSKDNDELMWHTKNGASYTLLFVAIGLFASVMSLVFYFGAVSAFLFGAYFAAIALNAYNAMKGTRLLTPILSAWAQSLPLEKLTQKKQAVAPTPVEAVAPVLAESTAPAPVAAQAVPEVQVAPAPAPIQTPVTPEPPQTIQ